jgi:hypothetical protein
LRSNINLVRKRILWLSEAKDESAEAKPLSA